MAQSWTERTKFSKVSDHGDGIAFIIPKFFSSMPSICQRRVLQPRNCGMRWKGETSEVGPNVWTTEWEK